MIDGLPPGRSNQLAQLEGEGSSSSLSAEEIRLRVSKLAEQQALDPSKSGTAVCERCCYFFEYRPRSQAQIERLHQSLFMTGPAVQHIHRVCNTCFDNIVGPALRNDRVEMVGIANAGHPNLALSLLR